MWSPSMTRIASFCALSTFSRFVCAIVVAMVISRLDYCNSVFIGLPADQIAQLQRVQNNAAQLVLRKRRRDHIKPLLKELHWLPVKFCCQYKIATLAYRHFDRSYEPSRSLRSSNEKLLKITKRKLRSFGQRSFSFMISTISLELTAGHSKKCTNIIPVQISLKTLSAQAFQ